jgi:methyl-accepting chemotaxis protein
MKLTAKMLLPPLGALAVVLGISLVGTLLSLREAARSSESAQQHNEVFMTLVAVQSQLGEMHSGIYRSITLMSSMADAEVQKLRGRLKDQASGVTRTLASLVEMPGVEGEVEATLKRAPPPQAGLCLSRTPGRARSPRRLRPDGCRPPRGGTWPPPPCPPSPQRRHD